MTNKKFIHFVLVICLTLAIGFGMVACASESVQAVDFHIVSQNEYIRDGKKCILYRVYADKDGLTEEELIASFQALIKRQNDGYYLHDVLVYSRPEYADGSESFDVANVEELSKGAKPVVEFANYTIPTRESQPETATGTTTEPETTIEESEVAETYDYNMSTVEAFIAPCVGSFPYHEIECTETGITVSFSMDGAGSTVANAKAQGKTVDDPDWVKIRNAIIQIYDSIRQVTDTLNVTDIPITVNFVNDKDTEEIIVSVIDGEIVYDILAE